jgi:hypothetical protein
VFVHADARVRMAVLVVGVKCVDVARFGRGHVMPTYLFVGLSPC